jgi:Membrane proteins related to metalloendopeptidases
MALSDYLERLQQIAPEGPRATDFAMLTSQRAKTRANMMEQLKQAQARNVQFNAYASQGAGGSGQNANPGQFQGYLNMFPLKGQLRVTSPYGVNRKGHSQAHSGIDWGASQGTPIYAPGAGVIRRAGFDKIYGNQTIIDLGGGRSVMLGHQSAFNNIKAGQAIRAGQIIGFVGSTGWSTGPHLHFETWINNKPVNPLTWFQ